MAITDENFSTKARRGYASPSNSPLVTHGDNPAVTISGWCEAGSVLMEWRAQP